MFSGGQTNGTAKVLYKGTKFVEIKRPDIDAFAAQLDLINSYAALRWDRGAEIYSQLGAPTAFYSTISFLHPTRTPRTLELLNLALGLASFIELPLKHMIAALRPIDFSPQIQPMIATPRHGALPSGHATEAFIFATVLDAVLKASGSAVVAGAPTEEQLYRQATRIAVNRTVAGVHFPVDSIAGAMLGRALGRYLVARGKGGSLGSYVFKMTAQTPAVTLDFDQAKLLATTGGTADPTFPVTVDTSAPISITTQANSALKWLWDEAVKEWQSA